MSILIENFYVQVIVSIALIGGINAMPKGISTRQTPLKQTDWSLVTPALYSDPINSSSSSGPASNRKPFALGTTVPLRIGKRFSGQSWK